LCTSEMKTTNSPFERVLSFYRLQHFFDCFPVSSLVASCTRTLCKRLELTKLVIRIQYASNVCYSTEYSLRFSVWQKKARARQ
jgi:hypothetical protein